jgi:hypothetical protein
VGEGEVEGERFIMFFGVGQLEGVLLLGLQRRAVIELGALLKDERAVAEVQLGTDRPFFAGVAILHLGMRHAGLTGLPLFAASCAPVRQGQPDLALLVAVAAVIRCGAEQAFLLRLQRAHFISHLGRDGDAPPFPDQRFERRGAPGAFLIGVAQKRRAGELQAVGFLDHCSFQVGRPEGRQIMQNTLFDVVSIVKRYVQFSRSGCLSMRWQACGGSQGQKLRPAAEPLRAPGPAGIDAVSGRRRR